MSEARKLEPEVGLGDDAGESAPLVAAEAKAAPAIDLAPVLIEQSATLTGDSQRLDDPPAEATLAPAATPSSRSKGRRPTAAEIADALADAQVVPEKASWLVRLSNAVMVLFVSGAFAFLLGAAVAAAVVLGMLDLQSGWLKDALKLLKDFAKSLAGSGHGTA